MCFGDTVGEVLLWSCIVCTEWSDPNHRTAECPYNRVECVSLKFPTNVFFCCCVCEISVLVFLFPYGSVRSMGCGVGVEWVSYCNWECLFFGKIQNESVAFERERERLHSSHRLKTNFYTLLVLLISYLFVLSVDSPRLESTLVQLLFFMCYINKWD